jgi:hypothetical protein
VALSKQGVRSLDLRIEKGPQPSGSEQSDGAAWLEARRAREEARKDDEEDERFELAVETGDSEERKVLLVRDPRASRAEKGCGDWDARYSMAKRETGGP